MSRELIQKACVFWAKVAFGNDQATNLEQRGLRLVEEAVEAAQAANCDKETLHKIVDYVYLRESGNLFQEIGGVGITLLVLADAGGVNANLAEEMEFIRVISKPLETFAKRNQEKNNAGFIAKGLSL